jgi:hypothetical protein
MFMRVILIHSYFFLLLLLLLLLLFKTTDNKKRPLSKGGEKMNLQETLMIRWERSWMW